MLDRLSVPRRALDFEDYVDILRRNVRWLIGPAFAGLVISTVVTFLMEDTFESYAVIRVVPQQINGNIVQSIASQDVTDRIQGMAQTILSRGTLSSLINTYGLYKEDLKREPIEDVISKMHDAIKIQPVVNIGNIQSGRNIPAMRLEFSYHDRLVAKKVCDELVSRFLSASDQGSLQEQVSAEAFLHDSFDAAARDLNAADQKLQDYKLRNTGKLPEELQANMAAMNALEQRLASLNETQTRTAEQKMMYETQLHSAKDRLASVKSTSGTSAVRNQKQLETEKEIEDLQTNIASMKERYTDEYPDLQAAKDRLAVLKRQRDEEAKAPAPGADPGPESTISARERLDAQGQVEAIETALKALKLADVANTRDVATLNGQLHLLQARIQESPAGEKEYAELTRDHEVAKSRYDDAQKKWQLAKDSLSMERQKQGETMELLDAASTPTTQTSPKRSLYIPMGPVLGLVLGFIIVAIREVRDTSLKNLKDARLYTQLSILGSVPLLENDVVVQRRKQVMWVGWATATILGLAIMAGSVAHYYLTKS